MAKGFARLGILLTLIFIVQGASAAGLGELLFSGASAGLIAVPNSRGNRFGRFHPAAETIDRRENTTDHDRRRIESDLLNLPAHYQTLASSRLDAFAPKRCREHTPRLLGTNHVSAATARVADGVLT